MASPRRFDLGLFMRLLAPLLLLATLAATLLAQMDRLPLSIPIHYNLAGVADAFAPKSPMTVFGSTGVGGLIALFLLVLGLIAPRMVALGKVAEEREKQRVLALMVRVLSAIEWLVALVVLLHVLPWAFGAPSWLPACTLPATLGCMAYLFAIGLCDHRRSRKAPKPT